MQRGTISAIRYGYGLGPNEQMASDPDTMIASARSVAKMSPRVSIAERAAQIATYRASRNEGDQARQAAQRKLRGESMSDVRQLLAMAVSEHGFGARLLNFWSDHFTVAANGPLLRVLAPDFIERAIRPHIAGSFPDMLKAAATHPAMLIYLNQVQSIGPNSRAGQRQDRGLNENLAREILELHTLGVGSSYSQADVQGFAELLTGLSANMDGFLFRAGISEPGPHVILGKSYGARRSTLMHIEDALDDIALHEDTARHLARKLITHFIGNVDDAFAARLSEVYLASKGDLAALYAALLEDDRAWDPMLRKAKLPFDYIASALRAAGATPSDIDKIKPSDMRTGIFGGMQLMGQPILQPPGPDGWDENPEAWITPPGLAARIRWAAAFAERIEGSHDPRQFLDTALGDAASPVLKFAVGGSESRVEGITLTLVSPEFNRR